MKTTYTTEFRKGSHFINLSATQSVPFGIAMMATGRNKWMRKAESTCPKCHGRFTAEQLDGNAYCQECAIVELALA